MRWMTRFPCRKMKSALSPQVQEPGVVERVWVEQRGKEHQGLQPVSWVTRRSLVTPRPHRKKARTLSLVTLHQLVLVQCCLIPVFSVRQLNQVCLPNYRNVGRNEILLRKCSGNLEQKGLKMWTIWEVHMGQKDSLLSPLTKTTPPCKASLFLLLTQIDMPRETLALQISVSFLNTACSPNPLDSPLKCISYICFYLAAKSLSFHTWK